MAWYMMLVAWKLCSNKRMWCADAAERVGARRIRRNRNHSGQRQWEQRLTLFMSTDHDKFILYRNEWVAFATYGFALLPCINQALTYSHSQSDGQKDKILSINLLQNRAFAKIMPMIRYALRSCTIYRLLLHSIKTLPIGIGCFFKVPVELATHTRTERERDIHKHQVHNSFDVRFEINTIPNAFGFGQFVSNHRLFLSYSQLACNHKSFAA